MATSESDDFESADEELNIYIEQTNRHKKYTSIGSDSDDDIDYIPVKYNTIIRSSNNDKHKTSSQQKKNSICKIINNQTKDDIKLNGSNSYKLSQEHSKSIINREKLNNKNIDSKIVSGYKNNFRHVDKEMICEIFSEENAESTVKTKNIKETHLLDAKTLNTLEIDKLSNVKLANDIMQTELIKKKSYTLNQECWKTCQKNNLVDELKFVDNQNHLKIKNEGAQSLPKELMSNLKFKDIFKPEGPENLGNDFKLADDLSDNKYQPILDKVTSGNVEQNNSNDSWSGWRNWSMNAVLNNATVGVSSLTNHVTNGLSFLEEAIGVSDSGNVIEAENSLVKNLKMNENDIKTENKIEPQSFSPSYHLGNFISSMSSITKLVEITSTQVISGGLDTLETIGKKTMEVLQEGDPGFKKKRAFLLNESDKFMLSQILKEAKEKAEFEEISIEEKQLAGKIYFESFFDNYQGLMHLEALEILSEQCNIKIQQQLINLDNSEVISIQETLNEIKDLCDLRSEEDEDVEQSKKDLKERLDEVCKDLDISVTYEKLVNIWNDINITLLPEKLTNNSCREVFQKAISSLAEFTGYSIERFHKTAELLLIKEHRSTVNEADSLIRITNILSIQIGLIAHIYSYKLNNNYKNESNKNEINSVLKTIALEATNATAYIQEAFRLLIPIIQVGAI